MNRARNADHATKTCERFVYSIVRITSVYDDKTCKTHFLRNSRSAQRFVGFFFLILLFGCWLAEQTNSYHVEVLVETQTKTWGYRCLPKSLQQFGVKAIKHTSTFPRKARSRIDDRKRIKSDQWAKPSLISAVNNYSPQCRWVAVDIYSCKRCVVWLSFTCARGCVCLGWGWGGVLARARVRMYVFVLSFVCVCVCVCVCEPCF